MPCAGVRAALALVPRSVRTRLEGEDNVSYTKTVTPNTVNPPISKSAAGNGPVNGGKRIADD